VQVRKRLVLSGMRAGRRLAVLLSFDGLSLPAALVLAPILLPQGRALKRRIPLLPEAGGPRAGGVGGGGDRRRSLLIFGESTAAGVGVATNDEGIAGALARRLAARGGSVDWSVTARTGYTVAAARAKLLKHVAGEFDLIVVLFGVNDALGLTRRASWSRDIRFIIERLRGHLGEDGRIIVAGVPQLSQFQALPQPMRRVIGRHARSLDNSVRDLSAREPSVVHVPTPMPVSADALAPDGFHPSAAGYEQWAEHLATAIPG
jgi:lysophospholipase L1-like esterase